VINDQGNAAYMPNNDFSIVQKYIQSSELNQLFCRILCPALNLTLHLNESFFTLFIPLVYNFLYHFPVPLQMRIIVKIFSQIKPLFPSTNLVVDVTNCLVPFQKTVA
jgi:hypothetical protein